MDLKLNVQKRGLSTTAETINEEFTLHYGHIFRGEDAETLIIDYHTAQTLYNSGGQSEVFKSIYLKLVSNPSMNVAIRFYDESYIASSHIATYNAKYYIRVDCQYISKGFRLGGEEIWELRAASVNITPEGGVSLLQSYTKELVDSSLVSDDLTTFDETRVLSARQGAVLNDTKVGYVEKDEDTGDFVLYATNNNVSRTSNVEIGRIKVGCATPVTYAELCGLKLAGRLTAGAFYRITDYVTKVKPNHNGFNNTRGAEHPFDIIVQALDKSTLSENAQAIQHDGDTYFANSNLSAWKLKYSLENDRSRFAWASDPTRDQSWWCAWGVLETKSNNDASSNYEVATIEGKKRYLYRPTEPTAHLEGKSLYRELVVSSITSTEGFVYEADEAPYYDEEMGEPYFPQEIRVKTASGAHIATFTHDYDSTYYDEQDDIWDYAIEFSQEYEEVDGVFHLYPSDGIERWWDELKGGAIEEKEREYFNGSIDSLRYAFDTVLPKATKYVTEVTDGNYIYKADSRIDTIQYQSYVSPEDGGKGVIYAMTDEFDNFLLFDFKNIQFKDGSTWYYVFGATDTSLTGEAKSNYINCLSKDNCLFRIIFKGSNTALNYFEFEFSNDDGVGIIFEGECRANVIRNSSSGYKSIYVTEGFYSNNLSNNTSGAFELIGRMTGVNISYTSNLSVKGNFFGGSFYGNGTFQLVDSNGNNKAARNMKVNFGYKTSNVKLVYNGTTSSNTSYIIDTEIYASDWGEEEEVVNIDSYLNKNKRYQYLKIAKNSAGVIKVWCEADLVD